jgi:hypothetical protein
MKAFFMGGALAAPIIACNFIHLGNLKTAMVWCITASIEAFIVIVLDIGERWRRINR